MSHRHDRSQTPSILVHEQVQVNKDKKNINIDIAKSQQNAEKNTDIQMDTLSICSIVSHGNTNSTQETTHTDFAFPVPVSRQS